MWSQRSRSRTSRSGVPARRRGAAGGLLVALALWNGGGCGGVPVDGDPPPEVFVLRTPREPRPLRATLEVAGVLGLSTLAYYANRDPDETRPALNWSPESFERKLDPGDRLTFDTSKRTTNYVSHLAQGAFYYLPARVNGLGPHYAWAYAVAASVLWEYVPEYREPASINDMITTPLAGAVLGEVIYQFGRFFVHSYRNRARPAAGLLAALFGVPQLLHDRYDGVAPPPSRRADRFGFPAGVWHDFGAEGFAGTRRLDREEDDDDEVFFGGVELEGELVWIPGYAAPGTGSQWVLGPTHNRLELELEGGEEEYFKVELTARTTWAGVHTKTITAAAEAPDASGPGLRGLSPTSSGGSLYAGLASQFSYRELGTHGDRDWLGIAHVLGPTLDLVALHESGLRARAVLSFFGDFASVRSLVEDELDAAGQLVGAKSALVERGYSFSWGYSAHAQLEALLGSFGLTGEATFGFYDSLEGLSRFQEERVTDDFNLQDWLLEVEAELAYWVTPNARLFVQGGYRWRRSEARGFSDRRESVAVAGGVGWRF